MRRTNLSEFVIKKENLLVTNKNGQKVVSVYYEMTEYFGDSTYEGINSDKYDIGVGTFTKGIVRTFQNSPAIYGSRRQTGMNLGKGEKENEYTDDIIFQFDLEYTRRKGDFLGAGLSPFIRYELSKPVLFIRYQSKHMRNQIHAKFVIDR